MSEMTFSSPAEAPPEGEPIVQRWWRTVDRWTLSAVMILFLIGILLGLAASVALAERNGLSEFHYVIRQAAFGVIALGVMVFVSMQKPERIRRVGVVAFLFVFAALLLLPWLGQDFGKGATRWYSLGVVSVQPSEFLKPLFVIVAGWLMSAAYARSGPPGKSLSFALAVAIAGSLAMQPDFGQAALILATWGAMYFVAGAPFALLIGVGALVATGGVFAYHNSEHFARRIDGFLAESVDPRTQLGYAENAIQEGGFFGVGVGEGSVKNTLPDAHTDFIIAVAAEEYGLILCVVIIGLFLFITLRALSRLMEEHDPFIRLAGAGIAALFGLQAFVNLGVAIRLLPAKGMTLPFISYGGSSLIATGAAIGVLLAMTRRRPQSDVVDALTGGG